MKAQKQKDTPAVALARAMAKYIRKYGFTPNYNDRSNPNCGCFIHAATVISERAGIGGVRAYVQVMAKVRRVAGVPSLDDEALRNNGWTNGHKRDAAAVCDIVAALLTPAPT